ncbi:hypothetical protein GDO86_007603, partial [Hymenochirus boettgeri]
APAFGQVTTSQSAPAFGQVTTSQSTPAFGQVTTSQSAPAFGQVTTSHSVPAFGQVTTTQTAPAFGQATINQSAPPFGQTSNNQSASLSSQITSSSNITSNVNFGKTMPVFSQISSGSSPLLNPSAARQSSIFGQGSLGQGFQFGTLASTPSSTRFVQTSTNQSNLFSQASGTQTTFSNLAPVDDLGSEKALVSGEKISNVSQFGKINSESDLTQMSESLGNQGSIFKPPANSTFKPIFGTETSGKVQLPSQVQSVYTGSRSSGEMDGSSTFSFTSSDNKSKVETRPVCGSVGSSFSSFVSPTANSDTLHQGEMSKTDEPLKGVKRKEDMGRSPVKHELTGSREPGLNSDHPPEKRSSRLGRQLRGGANLYVRSLYDVVKSQMKTQPRKDSNKETETAAQHQDSQNESASSHTVAGRPITEPSDGQTTSFKVMSPAKSNQQLSSKFYPPATFNDQKSSHNYFGVGPIQPLLSRGHLTAGISQQNSEKSNPASSSTHLALNRAQPFQEGQVLSLDKMGLAKTPLRRARRADSGTRSDRTTPLSPNDSTVIHVTNIPPHLNQKPDLEIFFKKAGEVQRVYCKPARKMAIVHFSNHVSLRVKHEG